MQQRPVPKFLSFVAPSPSTQSEFGKSQSDHPHTGPSNEPSISAPAKRKRHELSLSERSDRYHHRSDRSKREENPSSSYSKHPRRRESEETNRDDRKAHLSRASEPDQRARRPAQFSLPETGISYYDDPYGTSGTLFLEVKYMPPSRGWRVLGVPSLLRVMRDSRGHTFEMTVPFRFKTRRDVGRQFKAVARLPARRLVASTRPLQGEEEGFIPISKPKSGNTSDDPPAYRSIVQSKHSESADGLSSDSDSELEGIDSEDEDTTDAYSAETARLTQLLDADRTNTTSWINLIAHSASTNPSPGGRSEIWYTMLEKAINAHPKNRSSDVLRLRFLEAVRDAKSPNEEDLAWDRALLEIKSSILWVEYIGYRLRKDGPEGIEKAVSRIWSEIERSPLDVSRKDRARLRVFWRAIVGLREAGFIERATAAMQAQIELSYFMPSELRNVSFSDALDALEKFWDSEALRVGEAGAKGWLAWKKNGDEEFIPGLPISTALANITNSDSTPPDGYQRWVTIERQSDKDSWLSARDGAEAESGDPYSTIIFSDIRALLFPPISSSTTPDLTLPLVFLQYLGLHIPGLSESLVAESSDSISELSVDTEWSYSAFHDKPNLVGTLYSIPTLSTSPPCPSILNAVHLYEDTSDRHLSSSAVRPWSSVEGLIVGKSRQMGQGWGPVKHWSLGACNFLSGHGPRGEGRMWESANLEGVHIDNLRNVFRLIDQRLGSEVWASYWVAFEAAIDAKSALKVTKTTLASYPHSLLLWSAHAQLHRIRGKNDAARKVYDTCLISSSTNSSPSWAGNNESPLESASRAGMWRAWAEMEWLEGRSDVALEVLCSAVGVSAKIKGQGSENESRIPLLRAQKAYEAALKSIELNAQSKVELISCFALMELIHTNDVPRTLEVFEQCVTLISPPAQTSTPSHSYPLIVLEERLAVNSALLIHHYANTLRNSCRPVLIRQHISNLIRRFPANTILLGVWLESERGEAIWGRVRAGISDIVLGGSDDGSGRIPVSSWSWVVWVEKWERGAWDAGRAAAVIRRALDIPRHRICSTLWKLLLELELRMGPQSQNAVRRLHGIVYQASEACSWVKDFYLYAFALSRPIFTITELENAINTMAERGLRLRARHALEDYLEVDAEAGEAAGEGSTSGMGDQDSDWGEAEIEFGASELARLKPYN